MWLYDESLAFYRVKGMRGSVFAAPHPIDDGGTGALMSS